MSKKSEQVYQAPVTPANANRSEGTHPGKADAHSVVLANGHGRGVIPADNRPAAVAQRMLSEVVHNGARMTAIQRKQARIFGEVVQRQLRRCTGPEFEGLLYYEDSRAADTIFEEIPGHPGWYYATELRLQLFYYPATRQYQLKTGQYWDPVSKRIFHWNGNYYVDGATQNLYYYDGNYYQPVQPLPQAAPLLPPAGGALLQGPTATTAAAQIPAPRARNWVWNPSGYMEETVSGNLWPLSTKKLVTRDFTPVNDPDQAAEAIREYERMLPEIKLRQEAKRREGALSRERRSASAPSATERYLIKAEASGVAGGTILRFYDPATERFLGQIHYYFDDQGNFSFDLSKLSDEARGIGPYLIHEAIRRGGQHARRVLIGTDDDGSGRLIKFYQELGFENVAGGGMSGDPNEIMHACELKFSK